MSIFYNKIRRKSSDFVVFSNRASCFCWYSLSKNGSKRTIFTVKKGLRTRCVYFIIILLYYCDDFIIYYLWNNVPNLLVLLTKRPNPYRRQMQYAKSMHITRGIMNIYVALECTYPKNDNNKKAQAKHSQNVIAVYFNHIPKIYINQS